MNNHSNTEETSQHLIWGDINNWHPILSVIFFCIMMIYMITILCKYTFSWRSKLIMASFVIVNILKIYISVVIDDKIAEANLNTREI